MYGLTKQTSHECTLPNFSAWEPSCLHLNWKMWALAYNYEDRHSSRHPCIYLPACYYSKERYIPWFNTTTIMTTRLQVVHDRLSPPIAENVNDFFSIIVFFSFCFTFYSGVCTLYWTEFGNVPKVFKNFNDLDELKCMSQLSQTNWHRTPVFQKSVVRY